MTTLQAVQQPTSPPPSGNQQLAKKGILIKLNISSWTARRKDAAVTEATNNNHSATKEAGNYQKNLISKNAMRDINRAANEARTFHYKMTLPWGDDGERILAADMMMHYTKGMRDIKQAFEYAVREFINKYPALIIEAQTVLGSMFNSAEYPSTNEVRGKFSISTLMRPVPLANDFRVEIAEDEKNKIKAALTAENDRLTGEAMKEVWNRVYNSIKLMSERLSEDKPFRKNIIENVIELCDLLPQFNMMDDPDLTAMGNEIKQKLCGSTPKQIREDGQLREDLAQEADAIANKMSVFMGKSAT